MKRITSLLLASLVCTSAVTLLAAPKRADENSGPLQADTFTGLAFRGLGPGLVSGRITDIVVHPHRRSVWYVAVASGGVWKTTNAGTTWTPLFDKEGSYSIGCLALDPRDPLVIWVGTGENNSQRSVGYGDGVYKSVDGGKTWKRTGLENSEHIGKIVIDPRNTDVVYVAAQGPLWSAGGDRGLYKTTDGGDTWNAVLEIDDHTGVNEVLMDPRDGDVLYASSYQRRRRVWTLIDGGPGSGIHKSTDAGATWTELTAGLPEEDMGRIGLALAPSRPDTLYAIVEATADTGGFFRSTDAGAGWEKMSDYMSSSPQYYNEIVADPRDPDRVYSLDTFMHVTENGGKSFERIGGPYRHVDDHAMWIDPDDTDYWLVGCDGGVYETWDRGSTWHFKPNLPVTQFYKVAVDNDSPFYNIYGGTQDNATLGGPSRTTSGHGITNEDWFVTVFGDGFDTQVDPDNPDIVYSQYQYGGLVRFDRASGEIIDIQPQPEVGEDGLRWNWDAALLISPHSPTRLYFGANRLFRSDDRGDSWRPVSGDLTRGLDRNKLEIMERVQSVDAVAKNASTSFFGNIVALSESTLTEGLLVAGTDDGLVQITNDGGDGWRRIASFPAVPDMTYVSDLETSRHDADTIYATFNNHKNGDFKPYILRSTDQGRSWTSISGDLPERGSVYTLMEDHIDPDLLFVGTEFGVFFTVDGGNRWVQLKGGMPVIAVRELEIQRRENDLVAATFGRGFYILDDYAPLRDVDDESLEREVVLFPVKDAWMYMERFRLGIRDKAFQGDSYWSAPNPPFGAIFTYYLKDGLKTRQERRRQAEADLIEQGEDVPYPDWEALRAEDREEKPAMILTVRDTAGNVVRRLTGPVTPGIQRLAWDLRYPAFEPVDLEPPSRRSPWASPPEGPMAAPGTYSVELARHVDGRVELLGETQTFETSSLGSATLPAAAHEALLAFQQKTGRLQRAVLGTVRAAREATTRLEHLKAAWRDTPAAEPAPGDRLRALEIRLADLRVELEGDRTVSSRNEPTRPSIVGRVQRIVQGHWSSTSAPTATQQRNYEIAAAAFGSLLPRFTELVATDLAAVEAEMDAAGAPWTPGRIPRWQPE